MKIPSWRVLLVVGGVFLGIVVVFNLLQWRPDGYQEQWVANALIGVETVLPFVYVVLPLILFANLFMRLRAWAKWSAGSGTPASRDDS